MTLPGRRLNPTGFVSAAAVMLLFSGCALPGGPSAGPVSSPATADAFSLRVGDCTGPLTSGTVEQVMLVPCADPHSWEVFASTQLPGDEFPGAGKVQDDAETFCNAAFKDFIGLSVGKSDYDLTVLQPTKQTWTSAADRTVTCLAGKDGGKIEGSLKDAGK